MKKRTSFMELAKRLAKGLNFKRGTVVLITEAEDSGGNVQTFVKGTYDAITTGIIATINTLLEELTDESARKVRTEIKAALINDEERRFQAATIEEGDAV